MHWNGFAEFQDRRAAYTLFVKTLLGRTGHSGGVVGRIGSTLLAAFLIAVCLLMIAPSRPRQLDPRNPPEDWGEGGTALSASFAAPVRERSP